MTYRFKLYFYSLSILEDQIKSPVKFDGAFYLEALDQLFLTIDYTEFRICRYSRVRLGRILMFMIMRVIVPMHVVMGVIMSRVLMFMHMVV